MDSEIFEKVVYDAENKIWNSTEVLDHEFCDRSVADVFLKTMRSINKTKILDYFYDKQIAKTAQQVYEESIRIALNLKRLGIKRNDVIVLFSSNNEWSSVLAMGSILAGAQINCFETKFSAAENDTALLILKPTMIIYEEQYANKIKESLVRQPLASLQHIISIDGLCGMNISTELLATKEINALDYDRFQSVTIENPQLEVCCLALTSGTTGMPKVVQLSHAQVLRSVGTICPDDVLLCFSPLRWQSQFICLTKLLVLGITRISCHNTWSATYAKTLIRECQPTNIFCNPTYFYEILMTLDENDRDTLSSLKVLLVSGETPNSSLKSKLEQHNACAKLLIVYGMTEMGGGVTMHDHVNGGALRPGFKLQLLNEKLEPVGPNECGQLVIKHAYPFLGYKGINSSSYFYNDDYYKTGDYGYMDDNCQLHVLARCKDLVMCKDAMLIPSRVEFPLLALPEIQAVCLVGYSKSAQDTHQNAVLFGVLNSNTKVAENEMRLKILQKLQSYLLEVELNCIQNIHFIKSMPKTTCNKTDREALRKMSSKLLSVM